MKVMADTLLDRGGLARQANAASKMNGSENQLDEIISGWNELGSDGKIGKEAILQEHFLKAQERFNAGVSLAKIRRHYEKLGAKYSPVTFRKKWDDLVRRHAEHG